MNGQNTPYVTFPKIDKAATRAHARELSMAETARRATAARGKTVNTDRIASRVREPARFADRSIMDTATKETLRKIDSKIWGLKQDVKKWQGIRDFIAMGGSNLPNDAGAGTANHPALHKI